MADTTLATVTIIEGIAYARDMNGDLRELQPGSPLQDGETVVTPAGGHVVLELSDATYIVNDGTPSLLLTRDLLADDAATPEESALEEHSIDDVLAALEGGADLGKILESTVVGSGEGDSGALNEGHSWIKLGRMAEHTPEFDDVSLPFGIAIETSGDAAPGLTMGSGNNVLQFELGEPLTAADSGEASFAVKSENSRETLEAKDLLIFDLNAGEEVMENLGDYLNVTSDGTDTVIEVSSAGGFAGGFDPSKVDQTITIEGIDFTEGGDVKLALQNMLDAGQLGAEE